MEGFALNGMLHVDAVLACSYCVATVMGLWESIVTRFIGGLCKALKRPYREAILFIGVNATFSKRDRCIFVHRVDIA